MYNIFKHERNSKCKMLSLLDYKFSLFSRKHNWKRNRRQQKLYGEKIA